MRFELQPSQALALLSSGMLAGCASPGPPQPPSLHLPELATNVAVVRQGDDAAITFNVANRTTDGPLAQGPITAVLCRSTPPGPCTPVGSFAVMPGPATETNPLPPELTSGPARLLAYQVELRNANGRSAGLSAPVYTAAGPAPAPVRNLTARPSPRGVLIEWEAPPAAATVYLRKHLVNPVSSRPVSDTMLQAEEHRSTQPRTGVLDDGALTGQQIEYTAQRVHTISLSAPTGTVQTVMLQSLPSTAASVLVKDIFPPARPTGLVAIQSIDPAKGTPTIDLSWHASAEPDLAGYNIYREQPGSTPRVRVNASPIHAPAYVDAEIAAGAEYRYTVTSVDLAGNESAPSDSIQQKAP